MSVTLKMRLTDVWKDFSLVIKNFTEVPISEINHYQMLVLKNMVDDKYSDSSKLEAIIEADIF